MLIEIYSKTNCSFCTRAKTVAQQYILNEYGHHTGERETFIELKVKMLDEDFSREQLMEQFPKAKTFPQIRIDGKIVGGSSDFETWILENGNNR